MSSDEISGNQGRVQDDLVQITVVGQDQRLMPFTMRPGRKLNALFTIYCQKREVDLRSVQFLYKGERIHGYQTPRQLKMKPRCEISAMMHQTGGGYSSSVGRSWA